MPTGDLRLNSHLVASQRTIALTTTYTEVLQANPLRVGLYIPKAVNSQLWNPYVAGIGVTGFSIGDNLPQSQMLIILFHEWGPIVQANWFARVDATTDSIIITELHLPQMYRHYISG